MSAASGLDSRRDGAPALARVLVVVVAVLSVVGAGVALRGVLAGPALRPSTTSVTSASTSWGRLEVHQSEVIGGLSGQAMGGMSHGVQNLVPAGKAEIAVSVTLTSSASRPASFAAKQFRLRRGRDRPSGAGVAPMGTSLSAGTLPPGGSVEGTLSFVVPTDGASLWLSLDDHGHTVEIPVGRATAPASSPDVGGPAPPTDDGHQH